MAEKAGRKISLILLRRISQAAFLLLFLFLFRKTDYAGTDNIQYAVNIFFRWDPLVAAAAMLATKTFIALLIPAFIVFFLSVLLGRFFCGWVCPLGTLIDVSHKALPPKSKSAGAKYASIKYYLLATILLCALFGVPLVGYFDPFSILVRSLTIAVDPAVNAVVSFPFDFIYRNAPSWVSAVSEPVFKIVKNVFLPFNQNAYELVIPTLLIFVFVFALEKIERRFWCRNLCPLGAMFGLVSRITPLKIQPGKACKAQGCSTCIDVCRMGAIDGEGVVSPDSCTLCMDCLELCDNGIIGFKFKRSRHEPAPLDISRRGLVGALVASVFVPGFLKARSLGKNPNPLLIRPPGAVEEKEFLDRCVRCGECMKVCIGNALHPAGTQAGLVGAFSPVMVPRIGFCEFNCTLCGQVCPTGAIEKLTKEKKHKLKVGLAWFDHNRCLPWAKQTTCIVCEELCPTPDKAIKFYEEKIVNENGEERTLHKPYIVDDLCIGCGICEQKCPLTGDAAVRVTSQGETRNPDNYF